MTDNNTALPRTKLTLKSISPELAAKLALTKPKPVIAASATPQQSGKPQGRTSAQDSNKGKKGTTIDKPVNSKFIDPVEYKRIRKYFRKKYPNTFPYGNKVKILAIGIHKDLIKLNDELKTSGMIIRKFLKKYTRMKPYKDALKVGAKRYNLAGEVTGKVIKEEMRWLNYDKKPLTAGSDKNKKIGQNKEASQNNNVAVLNQTESTTLTPVTITGGESSN